MIASRGEIMKTQYFLFGFIKIGESVGIWNGDSLRPWIKPLVRIKHICPHRWEHVKSEYGGFMICNDCGKILTHFDDWEVTK